jgi:hypothetical protein
MADILSLWK